MTDFLAGMSPIPHDDDSATATVEDLLKIKGIGDFREREIGRLKDEQVDGAWLYYYKIDGGILEVLVEPDKRGGWDRRVTDYIGKPSEVADMIGDWRPPAEGGTPTHEIRYRA